MKLSQRTQPRIKLTKKSPKKKIKYTLSENKQNANLDQVKYLKEEKTIRNKIVEIFLLKNIGTVQKLEHEKNRLSVVTHDDQHTTENTKKSVVKHETTTRLFSVMVR